MNWLTGNDNGGKDKPKGPSSTRITVWVVVGGFGAYLLITGIIGILTGSGQ